MIHVIDNYYIRVDTLSYTPTIDTGSVDKDGDIVYKNLGYCNSLRNAVKIIFQYRQKVEFIKNDFELSEALNRIEHINKEFEKCLDKCVEVGDKHVS